MEVDGLRCEGLVGPRGIEHRSPLLTWELRSPAPRAERPTAYHVLVASSPTRLQPGEADLWDSGAVPADDCSRARYTGRPLRSLERCYWAVRVQPRGADWTPWNRSGELTMGLVASAREWRAAWIHAPVPVPTGLRRPDTPAHPPEPWFQRAIQLDARPARATAVVASVGFHELFVNGHKVTANVLTPNVYDLSQYVPYVLYEIAEYLRAGPNVLGLWLGTGWSVYRYFQRGDRPLGPLVSAQVHFDSAAIPAVVTDGGWMYQPSATTLLGAWRFRNFGGESCDARRDASALPTLLPGSGDWQPARVARVRTALRSDVIEPNQVVHTFSAQKVEKQRDGTLRVDFGRNFAGFVEVPLEGVPGQVIDLTFSERPAERMTHRMHSRLILGSSGAGVFRSRFNYMVGRWATISGATAAPAPERVKGGCVRNAYTLASAFESSSPLLNRIAEVTRWTFENLTTGGFVADCPHRERMGYGGDGHASILTGLYHYRLQGFLTKWNRDWHDLQGHPPAWSSIEDPTAIEPPPSNHPGELPYTAPTYWGGGGPAWSGLCVHLPWQVYQFYGDKRVLEESLPTIRRWLDFIETKVQDGQLQRWGGRWDFLGDWLPPRRDNRRPSPEQTLLFNNCYRIWSLTTAAQIARAVQQSELANRWDALATHARGAVHRAFFDPASGGYADNSQVALSSALLARVPPASARAAVQARFAQAIRADHGGHIHAGITGGALLFNHLLEEEEHDLLHLMVNQPDYPGWGHMLARGATTWWESWEEPGGNTSSLHSSYLFVGAWPIAGVLGIRPQPGTAGFARARIAPGPFDAADLTWARGHLDTPRGRVAVDWQISENVCTLYVTIPPGMVAEVALPGRNEEAITENNQPLHQATRILTKDATKGRIVVEVEGGNYRFHCPL